MSRSRQMIVAGGVSAFLAAELAVRLGEQLDAEFPEHSEAAMLYGDGTSRPTGLLASADPEPPTDGESRQVRRARARKARR